MLKKLFGLASLLLLITFLGAACTPAASQKDLQELQYKVQALSLSLETTQNNLQATQEALQNVQNQNQQLQNQLQQTSTECSTCDKAAQDCVNNIVVSPYGCVTTSPYYSNPCTYQPTCTPIGYSPCSWLYSYDYFYPYLFGNHYSPWGNHPFVPPSPQPEPSPCPHPHPSPCPQPHPHPSPCPHPPFVTCPHPIATEATAYTPATEPMAGSPITAADPPAIATTETTPAVTDSVEPIVEPAPAADLMPSPQIESATYQLPVAVPDQVLETTPSEPAITEPPAITEDPLEPAPSTMQSVEAINEPGPDSAAVTESSPEITPPVDITEPTIITEIPAAPAPETIQTVEVINEPIPDSALTSLPLPEITPEPALPVSSLPVVEPAPTPEPTLTTYSMPAAVPDQVLETPPALAATNYPVITEAPAVPIPPDSETAKKATDETNTDSTL
jgi:hypothetical protein